MVNWENLKNALIFNHDNELNLIKDIKSISLKFTQKREFIEDYLNSDNLVAAYSHFFMRTNIPKFQSVLEKLPSEFAKEFEHLPVIEVGCGPGTYLLANFLINPNRELIGIEKSKLMRKQATQFLEKVGSKNFKIVESLKSVNMPEKSLLIFGNSANEMTHEQIFNYINAIKPLHILFIEPGTFETFNHLYPLREKLRNLNFNISYPCFVDGKCPLAGSEDWCHQYLKVSLTDDLKRICQLTGIDRSIQAQTIWLFSKSEQNQNISDTSVIIRRHKPTKSHYRFEVCHKNLGENKVQLVEISMRGLSKIEKKTLDSYYSGDRLEYQIEKVLDNGIVRVKIV